MTEGRTCFPQFPARSKQNPKSGTAGPQIILGMTIRNAANRRMISGCIPKSSAFIGLLHYEALAPNSASASPQPYAFHPPKPDTLTSALIAARSLMAKGLV